MIGPLHYLESAREYIDIIDSLSILRESEVKWIWNYVNIKVRDDCLDKLVLQ